MDSRLTSTTTPPATTSTRTTTKNLVPTSHSLFKSNMDPEPQVNGNGNGTSSGYSSNGRTTPTTPRRSTLAMTEYTAMPTPPSERADCPKYDVPPDFLLPSGYPDYLRLILTSRVYDVVTESPSHTPSTCPTAWNARSSSSVKISSQSSRSN